MITPLLTSCATLPVLKRASSVLLAFCLPALSAPAADAQPGRAIEVSQHGASGNGQTDDTDAINHAIEKAADMGGGVVRFPPGRYLSGTLSLKSHVHLQLEAGAWLIGTTNLSKYKQPVVPDYMPEARWGKWHRALILGQNVTDVEISGPGTIDGNKVFDPTGEERMRGPHTIVLVDCRNVTIHDLLIKDSANYAIFFQITDDVEIRNVRFVGGWDGVHFRGSPNRWCRNVNILNCQFYTGDDSIAGRYWDNTVISGCVINSSCNGVRLIGPATRLVINDCLFYGPGVQPHRSSGRTNMLSGIILQPGAWDKTEGPLDQVLLSNNTMNNVASPVTIWSKPGNTINKVTVAGLQATGVYRSAFSVESWADTPATNVIFRNCSVEFAGGGKPEATRQQVKGPGVDARPLPAWGLYARNVERITLEDVRFSVATNDYRPVVQGESVEEIRLDNFRYPNEDAANTPIVTNNVKVLRTIAR